MSINWQQALFNQIKKRYQQHRLPHALLFAGEKGVGKKNFSDQLVHYLLCSERGDQACGHCHACELFMAGHHPDFLCLSPEDNKMIKVDEVRALSKFVNTSSQYQQAKIVLIQHADRMNTAASNALLKTLEEPANNVYLMLLVERPSFLPATIRSRCQIYRIDNAVTAEENAEEKQMFFQDCCEFLRKRLSFIEFSEKWYKTDLKFLCCCFLSFANDLLRLKLAGDVGITNQDQRTTLEKLAHVCSLNGLLVYIDQLTACKKILSTQITVNSQLMVENLLLGWRKIL